MEATLRYVLIFYAAGLALSMAFHVGQHRSQGSYRHLFLVALFTYALMSPGIWVWWSTPDLWSVIGKYTVLGLLLADLAYVAVAVKYPPGPVLTTTRASVYVTGALAGLVCIVFLWP